MPNGLSSGRRLEMGCHFNQYDMQMCVSCQTTKTTRLAATTGATAMTRVVTIFRVPVVIAIVLIEYLYRKYLSFSLYYQMGHEAPPGGPRSRNHTDFLSFSRIHAINEKFGFSRKKARIGQKKTFHEITHVFG